MERWRGMSKGPQGQKRPTDVVGCAVTVARIATGEVEEKLGKAPGRRKSGKAGAAARVKALTADQRSAIARKAAAARWE